MLDDKNDQGDDGPVLPAQERRGGKRHSIVLLIGRVCRGERESVCLVHNISKFGLMARFTTPPTVGDRLRIEVRGLPLAAGTVRWVKGVKAGFEFDEPQDVDRVFTLTLEDGRIARSPRFPIAALARMRFEGAPFTVATIDISAGGAKLMGDTPVTAGLTGQIMLPDMDTPVYGTVCWTRDDQFGFRFSAPLSLTTLSQVLGC